ncbi:hypothetical protein B0J15DRAFT_243024 [Fusarium solani]|uniref:Uncharacterized protein n=1 Tax=Fusarium solani TaxID=169388 RepID=A0A9P9KKG5_FUSSL|nr:uncharacterized protein B0J15DRAFT_243024 [Fusarium solani]KAH7266277.1 hypothetical protein B0J15DRAFT_243024 [Fusarium solani]
MPLPTWEFPASPPSCFSILQRFFHSGHGVTYADHCNIDRSWECTSSLILWQAARVRNGPEVAPGYIRGTEYSRHRHGWEASEDAWQSRRQVQQAGTWDLVLPIPLSKQCTYHSRPGVVEWLQKPLISGMLLCTLTDRPCLGSSSAGEAVKKLAVVTGKAKTRPGFNVTVNVNQGTSTEAGDTEELQQQWYPIAWLLNTHESSFIRDVARLLITTTLSQMLSRPLRGGSARRDARLHPGQHMAHGHERMHGNGTSCTRT